VKVGGELKGLLGVPRESIFTVAMQEGRNVFLGWN